jgi:glycosyltransferase involved in cell wall biosynthesis
LASVAPQARDEGAEVLVVSDGPDQATGLVAERHGVQVISLPRPTGANAARNRALDEAHADLIVFIDDDVDAPPGWLAALLDGVRRSPEHDVFGGPIRARLEGGGPRACGREGAPLTTLDLGPQDCDASLVWSANMAVRRRAFELLGSFDETIVGRGEEEEWQQRYFARGGRIRYIGGAGLEHRRAPGDATVRAMATAGYKLGRTARRNDVRKHVAPPITRELRTLTGCLWHIFRRRCAIGFVLLAESAGRFRQALIEPRQ